MAKAAKKAATKTEAKPPKKAAAASTSKTAKKPAAKASAGLMAPLNVSPVLAEVIGGKPMPRTEIIKKIWDYIKANDLQDKTNKRMINADEKLKAVFGGKEQVSMFELAKIVSNHVK